MNNEEIKILAIRVRGMRKSSIEKLNENEKKILDELIHNGCVYETIIKATGATMANPYDKFTPSEYEGLAVSKRKLEQVYGIKNLY